MGQTMFRCFVLILFMGCAPTLSSFQPAHVAVKGTVSAEMGTDLCLPTGVLRKTIDAATTIANVIQTRDATTEDKRQLILAGATLLLNPIAANSHAAFTYAFAQEWDASVRLTTGGWRWGARQQLLHQALDRIDLTLGVGLGHASTSVPRPDIVEKVMDISDPTRWNVDVALTGGKHGDFYRFWMGPRALMSTYSVAMSLKLPNLQTSTVSTLAASADGHAFYLGGQLGAGIGYRKLFLAVEMTMARVWASADIQIVGMDPWRSSMNDWVIYPGVGLLGEF